MCTVALSGFTRYDEMSAAVTETTNTRRVLSSENKTLSDCGEGAKAAVIYHRVLESLLKPDESVTVSHKFISDINLTALQRCDSLSAKSTNTSQMESVLCSGNENGSFLLNH